MNIDFAKIEEFCTTKQQLKEVAKLKKKFSITNTANKTALINLMYSFFVHGNLPPLSLLAPNLLTVKFEGNFNKWSGVEILLGILYASGVLDAQQKEIMFSILESIGNYPYEDESLREFNSIYLNKKLSLYGVNKYIDEIQKAVNENEDRYEYSMRLGLISAAAIVQAINKAADTELEEKMNKIIREQKTLLTEARLFKYS